VAPTSSSSRRALDLLAIALFGAASIAPTIDQFVRPDSARGPTTELRQAAPRPEFPTHWAQLSSFPQSYDAYYADTFGLRDVLLRWNSLDKFFLFDTAPSKTLVVGHDEWIFYSGDLSIPVFRGLLPFRGPELQTWGRQLELRRNALADRGIAYVFVIVPNKETVYPEKMPDALNQVGPTRREQFVAWMKAHSTVDVLDLTEIYRAEKAHDSRGSYLYNQHGTHWTGRGTYAAYRELMKHIGTLLPVQPPLAPIDLEWVEGDGLRDTWSKSMYIQDVLKQRDIAPVRIGGFRHELVYDSGPPVITRRTQASDPTGTRALLFHDSFGPYLWDLLPENFAHLCMRWAHYETPLVLEEAPKVVVEMYVERILVTPTPGPGESAKAYGLKVVFEDLPNSLFVFDEHNAARFAAVDGLELEPVHAGARNALALTSRDARQGALSPEIRAPGRGIVWLRTALSAGSATALELYWQPAGATSFRRGDHVVLDVSEAEVRQETAILLPPGPLRFLLRPRDAGVRIMVHDFEVRTREGP
jgi:alginate O-acetyltransferase complex protein AlgJ